MEKKKGGKKGNGERGGRRGRHVEREDAESLSANGNSLTSSFHPSGEAFNQALCDGCCCCMMDVNVYLPPLLFGAEA